MIAAMSFTNLNSVSINLDNDVYPVTQYDQAIAERLEKRPRSGSDGMWPTFSYDEGMEITIEGAILADDADDYYTKRSALTTCLRYKPNPKQRRTGVFYVTFDGASEEYYTDVTLDTLSIIRDGASPMYTPFRIVFYSFNPYYTGSSTSTRHYDI